MFRSCEEIHIRTRCGANLRNLPRRLAAVGVVERVERGKLLARGNLVRDGDCGLSGRVYDILLRDTRKPGYDDNGQVGSG